MKKEVRFVPVLAWGLLIRQVPVAAYSQQQVLFDSHGGQIRRGCGPPHHNLFPISYPEIERYTGAVLEQNPGYDGK